jgi:hypothetical protein
MIITTTLRRAAANVLAIGALTALLAACTLSSETLLVDPASEAAEPLAATFKMTSYAEAEGQPGVYTKGDDAPAPFALKDKGYVADDGSMTAYFVPTAAAPDTYLLALGTAETAMYGVARIRGDIMELAVIYGEDAGAQLTAAGEAVPAGVTIDSEAGGGVILANRAALDAMIALHIAGKAKLGSLVVWVGAGDPPATLKAEGVWYVPG